MMQWQSDQISLQKESILTLKSIILDEFHMDSNFRLNKYLVSSLKSNDVFELNKYIYLSNNIKTYEEINSTQS